MSNNTPGWCKPNGQVVSVRDAVWNEADHPRAPNGEFGSGGGSVGKESGGGSKNEIVPISGGRAIEIWQSSPTQFFWEHHDVPENEKDWKGPYKTRSAVIAKAEKIARAG